MTEEQRTLLGALVGLARASEGSEYLLTDEIDLTTAKAVLGTREADAEGCRVLLAEVKTAKSTLAPGCETCPTQCGRTDAYDVAELEKQSTEIRAIKEQLIEGLQAIAGKAVSEMEAGAMDRVSAIGNTEAADNAGATCNTDAADKVGATNKNRMRFLYKGLFMVGTKDWEASMLEPVLKEMEVYK